MGFWGTLGRIIATPVTAPVRAVRAAKERTMQAILGSLIRHALTALGGGLITNGTITSTDLEVVIGGVLAIAGVVWGVISKQRAAKRLEEK